MPAIVAMTMYRVTALYERDGRQFEEVGLFDPQHTLHDVQGWTARRTARLGDRLIGLSMIREARATMPRLESVAADWGD